MKPIINIKEVAEIYKEDLFRQYKIIKAQEDYIYWLEDIIGGSLKNSGIAERLRQKIEEAKK